MIRPFRLPTALTLALAATFTTACARNRAVTPTPAPDEHAGHAMAQSAGNMASSSIQSVGLPPDNEGAPARLGASPRHGEYVMIPTGGVGGTDSLRAWVVYPERRDRAPVVMVVHEIFGLSPWVRGVADQLAADGFIAVAPDLLTGKRPAGWLESQPQDSTVALIRTLRPADVAAHLDAVGTWSRALPAASGSLGIVGYCWGGSTVWNYASHAGDRLQAGVVYYGGSPNADAFATVRAPILGLYGGDDARVNATIQPASDQMKKLNKTYEANVYDGAGHGFLRQQDGRDGANSKAAKQAWPTTVQFLRKHTADGKAK